MRLPLLPLTALCYRSFEPIDYLSNLNTTSTKIPHWETDCENYVVALPSFELRDVSRSDHIKFVEEFAIKHGLKFRLEGTTAIFWQNKGQ